MARKPKADLSEPVIPDELRRRDLPQNDSDPFLPQADEHAGVRGIEPSEDGGIAEHPIHDEDLEDRGPEFYEKLADLAEGGLDSLKDETPSE